MQREAKSLILPLLAAGLLAASVAGALPVDGQALPASEKEQKKPAPKPAGVAALVARLGDDDWRVREQAMRDLMAMGAPVRQALRAAAVSRDPEVRWRASYALASVDTELELATFDPARAAYSLAAAVRAEQSTEAARRLYAEVAERFPNTRWAAAARERLAALGPQKKPLDPKAADEAAIAGLISRLGDASWAARQGASLRLAALGEAARPGLEAAARGADPEIAWRARSLLQRLDAALEPPKPKAAAGRDPRLVLELFGEAARAKQRPEDTTDLDAFVRALASDDATEAARARDVLQTLGQDALDPLIRALDGCNEATGVEIMDLLAQITGQELGFEPDRWRAWWRAFQERGKD